MNFKQNVRKLLRSFKKSGCRVFLKIHFYMFLTTWMPFHKEMEQCYQGNYDPVMMGDCADGFGTGRRNL
jgi:hypothetical protein